MPNAITFCHDTGTTCKGATSEAIVCIQNKLGGPVYLEKRHKISCLQ